MSKRIQASGATHRKITKRKLQVIEKTHPIKKFFSKTSSDDFLEENTEANAGNFNEAVSENPDVVCDPDFNQQSFSEKINTDLLLDVTGSFLSSFDIGNFKPQKRGGVKVFLSHDHKIPSTLPNDVFNQKFPNHLLSEVLPSGQNVRRDWMIWSEKLEAIFCGSCVLAADQQTNFTSGWSKNKGWRKLKD